jgi:hypothetical protein
MAITSASPGRIAYSRPAPGNAITELAAYTAVLSRRSNLSGVSHGPEMLLAVFHSGVRISSMPSRYVVVSLLL